MLETVDQVKSAIVKRFPRTDPDVQIMVESDFEVWIKALCRLHPWWFNTIRPGTVSSVFPVINPSTLFIPPIPGQGRWFHRGWLLTEPGVDAYEFKAPFDDTRPDIGFHDALVSTVTSIKGWTNQGGWRYEVPVKPQHFAMTGINMTSQNGGDYGCHAWVEHFPKISILRLHPTPMEEFILSVEFTLAHAPIYEDPDVPDELFNRFVSVAPDAVCLYGLMQLAEYFDEMTMYDHYRRVLYGEPPLGVQVAGTQHGGLLANLREQGANMYTSADARVEYYSGARMPMHGVNRRRSPAPGRYYG